MAHQIDHSKGSSAFITFGEPGWHGLGTVFTEPISCIDALTKGGLDFPVIKLPNTHVIPGEAEDGSQDIEIVSDSSFFTYRSDVNKVLGTKLGSDYTVLQNLEALNVVDEILQSGRATIETAGALNEGRKVFICLKVDRPIVVGSNDNIDQYILIANAHDGSMSVTATPTNIRVVCNNTLTAALRGATNAVKIRHTKQANIRLQEAAKVLGLINNNTAANEDNYNLMANTIISTQQMWDYFGNVFCTDAEIKAFQDGKTKDEVLSTRKVNIMEGVIKFANTGVGMKETLKGNDLTMWSAYNAVTGYVTRKQFKTIDDRGNSLLFGSSADTIHDAGVLAMEPLSKIKPLRKFGLAGMNFN